MEIRNDSHPFFFFVGINKPSWALGHQKGPNGEDNSNHALYEEWYLPRKVGFDVRTEIVNPLNEIR